MSTNANKINFRQKIILGEFMDDHPNLAKNKLTNCVQGRATSARLWKNLTEKLNLEGPPVKDEKVWRKVFADQKYKLRKKLSYNKKSFSKTGGGPYDMKKLTPTEELIISASGLEASVSGLNVKTFGAQAEQSKTVVEEYTFDNFDSPSLSLEHPREKSLTPTHSGSEYYEETYIEPLQENRGRNTKKNPNSSDKNALFTEYLTAQKEFNDQALQKMDKIVLIQEKRLDFEKERLEIEKKRLIIEETRFKMEQERSKRDLENKCIELEILKTANDLKSHELSKF